MIGSVVGAAVIGFVVFTGIYLMVKVSGSESGSGGDKVKPYNNVTVTHGQSLSTSMAKMNKNVTANIMSTTDH